MDRVWALLRHIFVAEPNSLEYRCYVSNVVSMALIALGALGGAALGGLGGLALGGLAGAALGGLAGATVGGLAGAAFGMPWYYPYWAPYYHPYYYRPLYAPVVSGVLPYYPMQWPRASAFGYW